MITSIDLFAGAGGLSLGLHNAGINCIGGVEMDRFAAETYKYNFPNSNMLQCDIKKLTDKQIKDEFSGVNIIAAGPPCQGFSVAGPSQYGIIDARNRLIFDVFRFVEVLKPDIAVFENVKGILHGKINQDSKSAIPEYIRKMEKSGYHTKVFLLQTADFGVPQWRERVFVISSKGLNNIPEKIVGAYGKGKKPWVTVRGALDDLPKIESGEGSDDVVPYASKAKTSYQKWSRKESRGVANHVAMKHTNRLIKRFKHIPIGGSLVDAPQEYGQRNRNTGGIDVRQRFKMNNQRLRPEKVSTAITASFQSNFIHYKYHRNLTAREGARLQSFPDSFIFKGPRTLMSKKLLAREGRSDEIGLSQYNQIGNAVPPLLAEAVGKAIGRSLCPA